MRDRAYYRFQREKHIARKEKILRDYQLDSCPHIYDTNDHRFNINIYLPSEGDWHSFYVVSYRGALDKGKIHCSCCHCATKTRNKGHRRKRGNYHPSLNYKISERRKMAKGVYENV